jgi:uncharacterized membrane protein HdeD (DUF308 family)
VRNSALAQSWMALAGIVLVAVGLLGFIDNPIVGSSANALLTTDTLHNVVHLVSGALALYIAFGLRGDSQANATLGFGVLYAVIFVAVLVSPDLFGLFSVPANAPLHVIHAALAVVSLAVGYMARDRVRTTSRTTA